MLRRIFINSIFLIGLFITTSWGFFAHQQINKQAIFTLPNELLLFYKQNIKYIQEHAVDPDKRRYIDSLEAPKHYLDVENYELLLDSIPRKWKDAVAKYGSHHLQRNGIVPWQIQKTYYQLVKAFSDKNTTTILKYSSELGHYIGDAHVPLHTTNNHNGQLTDQKGIHAFWESRVPELFYKSYNLRIAKAQLIEDPLMYAWKIITHAHSLVDSVLTIEKELSKHFPMDQKYAFSVRNKSILKQYSEQYTYAYQQKLNGMIAKQMQLTIAAIGSYWYSAWIEAGQPNVTDFKIITTLGTKNADSSKLESAFKKGKIIGREY